MWTINCVTNYQNVDFRGIENEIQELLTLILDVAEIKKTQILR